MTDSFTADTTPTTGTDVTAELVSVGSSDDNLGEFPDEVPSTAPLAGPTATRGARRRRRGLDAGLLIMSLLACGFHWFRGGWIPDPFRTEWSTVSSRAMLPAPPRPRGLESPARTSAASSGELANGAAWVTVTRSQGHVSLLLHIAEDGRVDDVTLLDVVGADASLVAAVRRTARSWRYPVVLYNQQPVRSQRRVVVAVGPDGLQVSGPTTP